MKRILLASVIAAFSVSALANSFQHQSTANFGWGDVFTGEAQNWSLRHQFYLTPVSLGTVPYAEAAFINRNASVHAGYDYTRVDFSGEDTFSFSRWQLGGVYQDMAHNVYAAVNLTEYNGVDDRDINASLGYFVTADWLVKLDARHVREDGFGSYTDLGVSTKKLLALENGNFINIEASYMEQKFDDESEFAVAADYYFGRALSLGLVYNWLSDDLVNADADSFTVRSNWYLQPNLALQAAVTISDIYTSEEVYTLGASYRF